MAGKKGRSGGSNRKPIEYDGKPYNSRRQLANELGVTYQAITNALRNGHCVLSKEVKEIDKV